MLAKEQKMYVSLCVTVQNLALCLVNPLLVYYRKAQNSVLCAYCTKHSTHIMSESDT